MVEEENKLEEENKIIKDSSEELAKEAEDSLEETPREQEENDEISVEEEAFEEGYEKASDSEEVEEVKEPEEKEEQKEREEKNEQKEQKEKESSVVNVTDNKSKSTTTHMIGSSTMATAAPLPQMKGTRELVEDSEELDDEPEEEKVVETKEESETEPTKIFALRTTANREEQVMDFVASNAARKKLGVYSVISPHGMRGYIFMEALNRQEAEQAAYGVPYAKGLLPSEVEYSEIEHMLEQVKKEVNIQKNDIAEILNGPFKREKCKITRIDKTKDEVVVELLEAAVPIPITLKIDSVKVIRREKEE